MAQNGNDIEKRLWAAADQLRTNAGLKPAEFLAPVLGLISLRHAEKRFAEVEARIGPLGAGGRRKVGKADYCEPTSNRDLRSDAAYDPIDR